jgi:hypothetical protein
MEIATIGIVGAAVLGRLLLERIVGRMLREVAETSSDDRRLG